MALKVYLAGGMRGEDWQTKVIQAVPDAKFFNPRTHRLEYPDDYTTWDTTAIEKCDLIFAYLSPDNPSGVGMAAEIGYARALQKKAIFVKDGTREDNRYWMFLEQLCHINTDDLGEAITVLKRLAELY